LKPQRGGRSIPDVAFIIFDVVAFEEFQIFLLERFCAVVFRLMGEVGADGVEIGV